MNVFSEIKRKAPTGFVNVGLVGVRGLAKRDSNQLQCSTVDDIDLNFQRVPRFDSNAKDVVYIGDAVPSFGTVNFNSVVYCCRVGQVLYKEKVPLWDSNSGKLSDFVTHFTFVIDTQDFLRYGHGLAFFLAPVGFTSPLNSVAGFLGLYNSTTSDDPSQGPIISVEFDSYSNQEWDPPVEHVGINRNSLSSATYAAWNASLHNKETANVWVSYNATTKNLSVFWTYERNPNFQGNSSLSYQVDLKEVLPSWVTIGITASTGEEDLWCVLKWILTRERKDSRSLKRFHGGSKQGKKEYITEVKIISSLRHRNLVQLIGWCHEDNQFLLVYEFMPNGSLDSHLFGSMPPLAWGVKYKISLGLASALLYLHEEWEQCVIHRDIKSSNVMLDSGFNVKLGDFGLARLMDHELGPQTTGLAGTLGYMAPEYVRTGKASKESDVYSFGVVAIEICCGRKARDCVDGDSEMGLVDWVCCLYRRGEILLAVDERLNKDFDAEQAKCLMMVGLWCAHPDRGLRPSIRQAIQVLNFEAPIPDLPVILGYHTSTTPASGSEDPYLTSSSINVGR
ncbi:concanavalin A-like lectin/glucanase superfamily protein [Tanacetum coccineum]|uniref:non-specific serine/threonine protein kinase n=1 Tax=Tanacetum coccineum TaxID=301880 RepID=A0ABQ5DLB8_9ASTR